MATALAAGIGHADVERQVGPGYPETVVGAVIDDHERLLGHVAFNAKRAVAGPAVNDTLVEVVSVTVVGIGLVTREAKLITLPVQLQAVDIMTVVATHAVCVHLALQERSPDVILFEDLPIRVIDALDQQRRMHVLQQVDLGMVVIANFGTPRVARRTDFHEPPVVNVAGMHRERIIIDGRTCHRVGVGPFDVPRRRPVAGFTTDVNLRPLGFIGVAVGIEILA